MRTSLFTIACLQATAAVAWYLPTDFSDSLQLTIEGIADTLDLDIQDNGIVFDASCTAPKKTAINKEIAYAKGMANYAASNVRGQGDFYYASFFSAAARNSRNFEADTKAIFKRASDLLSGRVAAYPLTFTCKNTESLCKNNKYFAYVTNSKKTINFCDVFFDPPKSSAKNPPISAANRLGQCKTITIREAHRTLAAIILHELMHTSYVSGSDTAKDYAYGWRDSVNLQLGVFNRGQSDYANLPRAYCPDPKNGNKDGKCNPDFCKKNADSYALTGAGLWFSQQCKRKIPDPNGSTAIPTHGPVTQPPPPEQPEDPPQLF